MMTRSIHAQNVGKKYLIAHQHRERYQALRDVLANAAHGVVQRLPGTRSIGPDRVAGKEEFWALRDLDLTIEQGDRIGIIGRNGAGKSTLLKVLSRITEPTTGRITIRGRVSSLLEVGTGFHPELTGRENIYLNGAILGMTKAEITGKFDEIVAFSEIERFLDTPVKRYSSGMYVRLAFSVAAHLDPEILIVDEVLAVGDAAFQKKCLGKMGEAGREGRTVLFVSHNMSAVRQLCERGVVLEDGQKAFDGEVSEAIEHYQTQVLADTSEGVGNPLRFDRPRTRVAAWLSSITLSDSAGMPTLCVEHEKDFLVSVEVEVEQASKDFYSALLIHDAFGNNIIFSTDEDTQEPPIAGVAAGQYCYQISVPGKLLKPGMYYLTPMIGLRRKGRIDKHDLVMRFEIVDTLTRRGAKHLYRSTAVVAPQLRWSLRNKVNLEAVR